MFFNVFKKKEPKEGRVCEYYSNGKIRSDEFYIKGKLCGIATYWHENGNVLKYVNYENDKLDGPYLEYHESGQLAWDCTFKKNNVTGLSLEYHENGVIHNRINYLDGIEHGDFSSYNKDGSIWVEAKFHLGKELKSKTKCY